VKLQMRLVLLSFLMLFVELALIRWLGANVLYLSFFSNFVLLGSFLGIGVGFLRARAPTHLFAFAPVVLALLVGLVVLLPVQIERTTSDVVSFGPLNPTGLPAWVMLPVIFAAVATIMAMIAEGVARTFVAFEPLEAYRLDITGSLLGIGAFSLLSFLWAPSVAWAATAGVLFLILGPRERRGIQVVAVAALLLILGRESLQPFISASPYYKVHVSPEPAGPGDYDIAVNGVPHQSIRSVERRRAEEPIYFAAYDHLDRDPGDVLIIGAGTGSDVAIALANGASRVDAVEIDPRLAQLGAELHPNHPYDNPRVTVHVDDGRAFLERTGRTYDLILFALPDSLTLVQGQGALRLESYLFTVQAIDAARERLADCGVFAMYNNYREGWLVERLAATLERSFGHLPCVDSVGESGFLAVLTVAVDREGISCADPGVDAAPGDPPPPVTDDYPFLYIRDRAIPPFYLGAIGLILLASVGLIRTVGGPLRQTRPYGDLFFMGAAFLLLETKSVVQFALLFGTTWFVNALVFAGILASVLAAIEVARRVSLPPTRVLYVLLLASVLVSWFVVPEVLLALDPLPRFLSAILIWFTPIFLANLVFAERFRSVGESNVAFGANLLGAMVGGLLEYVSLITGYQAMALVVAALYTLAFVTGQLSFARAKVPSGELEGAV
jgi:hypothetical protein